MGGGFKEDRIGIFPRKLTVEGENNDNLMESYPSSHQCWGTLSSLRTHSDWLREDEMVFVKVTLQKASTPASGEMRTLSPCF